MVKRRTLHLEIELTPLQAEIMAHTAKRKVVCAGRRAGKTTLAAALAITRLIDHHEKILITSRTQDQADAFWDRAKAWLHEWIAAGIIIKNEARRLLSYRAPDGTGKIVGRIRVKTGSNPDVLRGDDADLIIFDECALLDPILWYEVAAPMLADREGSAVFISTPRRKNFFFHLYQLGVNRHQGEWMAWHATSYANPHISHRALDELKGEMTADGYRQEILAEFLESDGQVFRRVKAAAVLSAATPYEGRFVAGLDWAMQNDYTVMIVMDAETRQMVAFDRFNQVDWALQRGRVKALAEKWKVEMIAAEANAIGSPNIEALQRDGLPVIGFQMTPKSKPPLIESLVLAFEQDEIQIMQHEALIGELEAYERVVNPQTGRSRYQAPERLHDDLVIALALAWWACQQGRIRPTQMQVSPNIFYR